MEYGGNVIPPFGDSRRGIKMRWDDTIGGV